MGITLLSFVVVLGVLIFFHEFGHFLIARLFGVGVEKFSLGFGPRLIGKTVGIAGDHVTGAQMAAGLTKALGVEIGYNAVPADVYRSFGFPGADDLGNMFQFKRDFNADFCAARSVEFSRALNPRLQTFAQWLEANAGRIPLA